MVEQYNVPLDLVSNNAGALLARMIKPNTVVLEFGPAYGKLTRYMKEELNCEVYIVEIDKEAAAEAGKHAVRSYVGDIERYEWATEYSDIKFDYAIFADVLEHLRNPQKVLEVVRGLLKYDGSTLLSVPNIAHNSVIIDLLNNKFEYKNAGLLDRTHIHFFTINSLEKMLKEAAYCVCQRYSANVRVGENEIANAYTSVEGISPSVWKNREYGEAFQWVYEAKLAREAVIESYSYLVPHSNHYFAQLFVDFGFGLAENITDIKYLKLGKSDIVLRFNLEEKRGIRSFRFDPLNANCVVEIKNIFGINSIGERFNLEIGYTNASGNIDSSYWFLDCDPQIYIPCNQEDISGLEIILEYNHFDGDSVEESLATLNLLSNKFKEKEEILQQSLAGTLEANSQLKVDLLKRDSLIAEKDALIGEKNLFIEEKEVLIKERDSEIERLNAKLELYPPKIEDLTNEINNKDNEIVVMTNQLLSERDARDDQSALVAGINEKLEEVSALNASLVSNLEKNNATHNEMQAEIDNLNATIQELHNSTSWRVTAPFRKLMQMISRNRT